MGHDHQHQHQHVYLDEAHWAAWAAHAELEGEVLLSFVTDTALRVQTLQGSVRRVADIGSGPGVGTCELARIFPGADVIAVDASPAMLERAAQRAATLGFERRIRTHLAELPDGLDGLESFDLIWASLSLHHVGDEVAALRAMAARLAPGGMLAIAEMADPTRILPADPDFGPPGLAGRIDAVGASWFAAMRDGLPGTVPSGELTSMVRAAGLDVVDAYRSDEHLHAPLSADARRFAVDHLTRSQGRIAEHLDADDLAAISAFTTREDLTIHASRQIVIARSEGPT